MFGEGPDLLIAPGFVTHLDLMWDLPPFEEMLSLGRIFRVIVLDKRGTGLSDGSLGFGSVEDRTEDIRAVSMQWVPKRRSSTASRKAAR